MDLFSRSPFQNPAPKRRGRNESANQVSISHWRINALFLMCFVIIAWIVIRLADVQVLQHAKLSAMARSEIYKQITLQPNRGIITDRQGKVLAMDVERQSLWSIPSQIPAEKVSRLALTLSTLIERDFQDILHALESRELNWVRVARWLTPSEAEQIASLEEPGLYLMYEPRRVYPSKEFAAHVIGAVNHNGIGINGVESFYNEELTGITGTIEAEFDSVQNPIAIAPLETKPPQHGVNLRLTIDPLVQYVAESELEKAVIQYKAEGGVVIVMEPSTGAIRGMAIFPSFDPNRYGDYDPEIYSRNPAVSTVYEPGSTFKMVTVAAGLQSRAFTADTQVEDPGVISRFDMRIHNWNSAGNGMIDPGQMLYYSSNVGAVQFNELTGKEDFYKTVHDFGFGSPTGVDLGGEEAGIVHDPSNPNYNEVLFLTNAYGQGIAATPLQMVQAAAIIANDGVLMKPYIVEERCWSSDDEQDEAAQDDDASDDASTHCIQTQPTKVREVIEYGVAWTIRRMLVHSANHYAPIIWSGVADKWLVPGYEVCAKTGTASIPLPEGGYDPYHVIGSVLGFAPAEDTRYVVLVKIDKPKGDAWGLATSVPVFYNVVNQLMQYERIPPNLDLFSPGQ